MAIVDSVENLEIAFCQSMFESTCETIIFCWILNFKKKSLHSSFCLKKTKNYCHYVEYIPMYNENLNLRSGNLLLISFSFGRCLGFYNNSVGKYCLTSAQTIS